MEPVDGLSPKDIARIRSAIRKVWLWSLPRKLCIRRCTDEQGFLRCEQCKERVPKLQVDHRIPVGDVDSGFISRLFCPSSGLTGLCAQCHRERTALQRNQAKGKRNEKKKA